MTAGSEFKVTGLPALKDNYIWLIGRRDCTAVAVVDPGEAEPVNRFLAGAGLRAAAILVTHHHWDHVNGVAALASQHSIPVFGPVRETIPACTHPVADGDRFDLPGVGLSLDALWVPGHTAGAIAYHGGGMVFTGDTLFTAGCGRLFEGTPQQMHASLQRLAALPGHTEIYCGHEYTLANLHFAAKVEPRNPVIRDRLADTALLREQHAPTVPATLALEKQTNPFLRCDQPSVVQAAEARAGRTLRSGAEVFQVIREWKDRS